MVTPRRWHEEAKRILAREQRHRRMNPVTHDGMNMAELLKGHVYMGASGIARSDEPFTGLARDAGFDSPPPPPNCPIPDPDLAYMVRHEHTVECFDC